MLALRLRLLSAYYALNYAGIIGRGLISGFITFFIKLEDFEFYQDMVWVFIYSQCTCTEQSTHMYIIIPIFELRSF